jgi:hypothetical protein
MKLDGIEYIDRGHMEHAKNLDIIVMRLRECKSCQHLWWTVEVPVFEKWTGGRAKNCPIHTDSLGRIVDSRSGRSAANGKYKSPGIGLARRYGGVYRRYRCTTPRCKVRWSTVEAHGTCIVARNILSCSMCSGSSKIIQLEPQLGSAARPEPSAVEQLEPDSSVH